MQAQIGVLVSAETGFGRDVLRGIYTYANSGRQWTILQRPPRDECLSCFGEFHNGGLGGIISFVSDSRRAQALAQQEKPVVNLAATDCEPPLSSVLPDDVAIGTSAADYLTGQGFQHFAYIGGQSTVHSARRKEGFHRTLKSQGFECHVFSAALYDGGGRNAVGRWLHGLPRPLAVFAENDGLAFWTEEACRQVGLAIPENVAVLGVSDDDLLCCAAHPPLSSVRLPGEQIGLEAALLLEGLMTGDPPPEGPVLYPPLGIAERQSSNILNVPDEKVAAALRFIRENDHRPIKVGDILDAVPMSRTLLEQRFRQFIGRAPYAEIIRVRIERAKRLLADTDMPIEEIAKASGHSSQTQFNHAFRRETGITPNQYREQFRRSR